MRIFVIIGILLVVSCGQKKKYHKENVDFDTFPKAVRTILEYQKNQNESFKDPETSPLPDRYRKNFESLDFFEPDTSYTVTARLERTPDAKPFLMPSTTGDKTIEVVYGIAHFSLNGENYQLEIYQTPELMEKEGYEDYLFLPFLDNTNGEETYGGGRYIDLKIPESDTIIIDFNRAYNPYCVYNKKYSCPLVPRQNYLNTKVLAGVKDFNKKSAK
ncbi:Hypothetical protein I595_3229 [Croceitalea dokdonensis DOKDO 023]|uniref:DUF1684 domain-containing protein n=1 Tax=Croceitalea dokdonensis DOKDO 023 TaxID=1300341 RepID=A0A0N8H3J3_9FLAO|nr:DUF1684 domain-containing protein [Croceitalea dokdonensis]KPM30732.1 Hypothetical protein I595_3229 [Croceitalea dokdonensis DOKDO 023]